MGRALYDKYTCRAVVQVQLHQPAEAYARALGAIPDPPARGADDARPRRGGLGSLCARSRAESVREHPGRDELPARRLWLFDRRRGGRSVTAVAKREPPGP